MHPKDMLGILVFTVVGGSCCSRYRLEGFGRSEICSERWVY